MIYRIVGPYLVLESMFYIKWSDRPYFLIIVSNMIILIFANVITILLVYHAIPFYS